ncbi:MAG: tryptophan--tRNA ligase [Deferribacterota bacterium]|nr:tryptophan--tRNA ligase [Deferribacterota bacterium]
MSIVLSGMRPTGRLHIGHYFGAIQNWVYLQDKYECYYFVADWHALTTNYEDTSNIKKYSREMVIDFFASGLSLDKSNIFIQSKNPYHAELFLILSMITPISWLERCPTYKEMKSELGKVGKQLSNFGFLGYPVLMASDILLYNAEYVPVGIDQQAHLELTRETARHFNNIFEDDVFNLPQPLITKNPKLPGIDGRKMSKSYNNAIWLDEDLDSVKKKILTMKTDTNRKRRTDPGNPFICPVFDYHRVFSTEEEKNLIIDGCKNAKIGCIDCKKILLKHLLEFLSDFQEKRRVISNNYRDFDLDDIISKGQEKACDRARKMIDIVRKVIKF